MGLFNLFFPQVCPVCGVLLVGGESHICLKCLSDLPLSYFWSWRDNPAEVLIRERVELVAAASLIFYRRESRWRSVIHKFKYSSQISLGKYLSKILGRRMAESHAFSQIDLIVPVPLHPIKRWMRGFNQASVIAKALSAELGKPVVEGVLVRSRYSSTQTTKDRSSRQRSVKGAFSVKDPKRFNGMHILLVDDVLTTGATIEACGLEIIKAEGARLSVATLAFVE
jgi:ComF family protein